MRIRPFAILALYAIAAVPATANPPAAKFERGDTVQAYELKGGPQHACIDTKIELFNGTYAVEPFEHTPFVDARGEFLLTKCRIGSGDGSNGMMNESLELWQHEDGDWHRIWRSRQYRSTYNCEPFNNAGRDLRFADVVDLDGDDVAEIVHSVHLVDRGICRTYVAAREGRVIAEVRVAPDEDEGFDLCKMHRDTWKSLCPKTASDITFFVVGPDGRTRSSARGEAAKTMMPPSFWSYLTDSMLDEASCPLRPL